MKAMTKEPEPHPLFVYVNCSELTFEKMTELLDKRLERLRDTYPGLIEDPPVVITWGYPRRPITSQSFEHLPDYDAPVVPRVSRVGHQILGGPQGLNPLSAPWDQE
jgi:hypothetical protein